MALDLQPFVRPGRRPVSLSLLLRCVNENGSGPSYFDGVLGQLVKVSGSTCHISDGTELPGPHVALEDYKSM